MAMALKQKQKTLKSEVSFHGIGVHSGQETAIVLRPSISDVGIIFTNKRFPDEPIHVGRVLPEVAMHATVIKQKSWQISTIEHLMAAISILGLDNVVIEVNGQEVPILDGSALPFVQGILDVGLVECDVMRLFLTPRETVTFSDDQGRFLEIKPAQQRPSGAWMYSLMVDYTADFGQAVIGKTNFKAEVNPDFFMREIAPARTFGFLEQLPYLRKHGLARGTSLGNTVVIGSDEFLNEPRFPDECVRHKVLDLLGDLSLLGKRLAGSVKAAKTGHNFNRLVIEHFIKNPQSWMEI